MKLTKAQLWWLATVRAGGDQGVRAKRTPSLTRLERLDLIECDPSFWATPLWRATAKGLRVQLGGKP